VHPSLLDKKMVTLFANMLKAPYYEYVMDSLTQQFTNDVVVAERIEQGVKSGRISAPAEKKGFKGMRREVDHVEGGYKGRRNQSQNYHTPSPPPQTLISTLHFLPKNLSQKTSKPKISQRRIIKRSRNNYPRYRYL